MAFAGLAERLGWLTLPAALHPLADPIVIAVAGALAAVEVLASLVPGIATAWEAVHTAVRPVAAGALAALAAWGASPRVVVLAALLAVELLASLIPLVATAWEAVHTALRPVGAGAVAVLAPWGSSPRVVVLAALLGGALGLATHATKLGLRAAVDLSPEPFTNAAATAAELSVVAALAWAVWHHPWIALGAALALLAGLFVTVRALWRLVRRGLRSSVGG